MIKSSIINSQLNNHKKMASLRQAIACSPAACNLIPIVCSCVYAISFPSCARVCTPAQPHPAKTQQPVSRDALRSSSKTGIQGGQRAGSNTKKSGSGGKGTWGKVGEEHQGGHVLDKGDPNYDDEAESAVFVASS